MSNEIKEARERMPIDRPFDPFTLLRCFGEEVLELRAHIDLISQKLVASESLYKAYKEDSKRMYRNSCKSYQEKIENLEKKIHELEKLKSENDELRLMLNGAALQIKMMQLKSKKDYSSNFLPIETAPKDGMLFLSWRKHSKIPVLTKYSTEYDWFESEDGDHLYDLVSWMPMPTITGL